MPSSVSADGGESDVILRDVMVKLVGLVRREICVWKRRVGWVAVIWWCWSCSGGGCVSSEEGGGDAGRRVMVDV